VNVVDEDEIRIVLARLARPHASGGYVVGHAAILAEGTSFAALRTWILGHGGTLVAPESVAAHGGLHAVGRASLSGHQTPHQPRQYLLPSAAFASIPEPSGVESG
jgi:hypothetical protein